MNITSLCGKSVEHAFLLHKESFSVINGAVSPCLSMDTPCFVKQEAEVRSRSGRRMYKKFLVLKSVYEWCLKTVTV